MAATDNTYFAPILPDFSKFFGDVDKKAREGGKQAGKAFSDSVGTSLKSAERSADKFADAYKRAQDRAADAAGNTRVAQQKLNEVLNNSKSTASQVAAATEKYEKAQRDEARAVAASEKAAKNHKDAQDKLAKATSEAGDAFKMGADDTNKFTGELGKAEGATGSLLDRMGGVTGVVTKAAGAFAAFKTVKNLLFDVGSAFDTMADTIRVGTGASGTAFEDLKESAKNVAAVIPAMDGGMEQVGSTLADLNTRLGLTGEPLEELTSQFIQLQNMGIDADINDVTGAFTQFGIAAEDTPAALDSLFQISQATGRSISELTGSLDKSGPALQQMGFNLKESAGLLGALDKAGLDADKTMGYMTKALSSFAKEGKDPQKELWGTINAIDELTAAGKDTEALNLANQLFGDRGGTGFLAAVKSGQFAYTDFMDSIGATSDTILGVADETASIGERWQTVKQQAMLAIEPVATALFDTLAPALDKVVDLAKGFGKTLKENKSWLLPLVSVIGGAASAWAAWNGAILAWQTITKIATAIQVAFNAVMAANPIMLAVMAIAALVAGLTYFFTQTETGQRVWKSFTEAISKSWQWLVSVFSDGVDWVKEKWNVLGAALSVLWGEYIAPIVQWIGDKWDWVKDRISKNIAFITDTVLPALGAGVSAVWDNVISPTVQWIGDKWNWVKDVIGAGVEFVTGTLFPRFQNSLQKLKDFFSSIVDGITSVWNSLRGVLAKPINFMINTVYNNGILSAWNTIAGILPGLEKGAKLAGIPEYAVGGAVHGPGTGTSDNVPAMLSNGEHVWTAREVAEVGGQGVLYAMRRAVDSGQGFTYDGNGGVAILPHNVDNRAGDLAGAAPGLLVRKYAKGGEVEPLWKAQLMRGHKWAKSRHGRPYVLGGSANGGGGTDCSGFMSGIANVIQGGDGARQWATMAFNGGGNTQQATGPQGFVAGLKANTLSIGVTNGGAAGGHTAGTLGAVNGLPATNVESGGASPSMVKYGIGAAGADNGYFKTHYHLPIGPDGAFVSGGNGSVSPEVMIGAIGKRLSGVIDKIMSPVVDRLPTKPPEWQGIPRGIYDKGKDGLTSFVSKAVGSLGDKLASVYSAVQGMGDLVKDAAKGTWNWLKDNLDVFDTGGVLQPGGIAVNKSKHPELVINHAQLGAFNRLATALGVSAESMDVMAKELGEAYAGRDWGYGELAHVLGNQAWAKALVDGAANLGEFVRTYGGVIEDVGDALTSAAKDGASDVLAPWGLEGLAGFELPAAFSPANLAAAYENVDAAIKDPNYVHPDNLKDTPAVATTAVDAVTTAAKTSTVETTAASAGETATVIKATSADDLVRVGDLEDLHGRVVRLEVEVDKAGKVPAKLITRGGVI